MNKIQEVIVQMSTPILEQMTREYQGFERTGALDAGMLRQTMEILKGQSQGSFHAWVEQVIKEAYCELWIRASGRMRLGHRLRPYGFLGDGDCAADVRRFADRYGRDGRRFQDRGEELNHSNIRLMGRPAPAPGMECFKETSNERKKLEAVAEKTEQPKDWYRAFEKKRKPYKRNLK